MYQVSPDLDPLIKYGNNILFRVEKYISGFTCIEGEFICTKTFMNILRGDKCSVHYELEMVTAINNLVEE